jgi:predicted membrane GTPase involved in stress response
MKSEKDCSRSSTLQDITELLISAMIKQSRRRGGFGVTVGSPDVSERQRSGDRCIRELLREPK